MASAVAVQDKRLAVFVVMPDVTLDGRFQRADVVDGAPADAWRRELGEEPFDLVLGLSGRTLTRDKCRSV